MQLQFTHLLYKSRQGFSSLLIKMGIAGVAFGTPPVFSFSLAFNCNAVEINTGNVLTDAGKQVTKL